MPIAPSVPTTPRSADNGRRDDAPFGLSVNTPQNAYQGQDYFLSIRKIEWNLFRADHTGSKSQYILCTNVKPDTFRQDFLESNDGLFACESYFPHLNIVIIKMETQAHVIAHGTFGDVFSSKLVFMNGLNEKIEYLDSARVKTGHRWKRADKSYRPLRLPKYRDLQWPSLAVEVGLSQTPKKLAEDAEWWLSQSNGEVRTVITISISQQYRSIAFEKWGLVQQVPTKTHRVVLSQEGGRESIHVSNRDPLAITFEDLFCDRLLRILRRTFPSIPMI